LAEKGNVNIIPKRNQNISDAKLETFWISSNE